MVRICGSRAYLAPSPPVRERLQLEVGLATLVCGRWCWREHRVHLLRSGEGPAEHCLEPRCWYDDSSAETKARDLTGMDQVIGRRATDAKELGGLFDREGEWTVCVWFHS